MFAGGKALMRLLNDVDEGIYFTDTERRIIFWNKAAARISGYSGKEVLGKKCSENILIHVDGRGRSLCLGGCQVQGTGVPVKDYHAQKSGVPAGGCQVQGTGVPGGLPCPKNWRPRGAARWPAP